MKELYFENVIGIGNLYLDYVFYEFENEPILFLCTDDKKSLYFCLCSDIRYEQKWIIMQTNLSVLKTLIEEEVDIASAFLASKNLTVITMDLQGSEKSYIVKIDEIDRLDLPKEGTFIRCNQEEARCYLWKKEWELLSIQLEKIANQSCVLDDIVKSYTAVIRTSMPINKQMKSYIDILKNNFVKQFSQMNETVQDSVAIKYEYSIQKSEKYVETIDNIDVDKHNNNILQAA